jgi:3',5'-cyclic AMP phosphodiesterase CpdA
MNKFFIFIFILIFSPSVALAKDLKFVQVTDDHLSVDGSTFSQRDVSHSVQTLKDTVNAINKMSDLDFVVFSGDNIDSSTEENLKAFGEITQKLNKPYYVILGNHDAYKLGGIGKNTYFKIVRQYDKYQKSTKSYFYFLPNTDFIIIMMDGATPIIPGTHGYYSEESLNWLDGILTKYSNKKAVIIQHFPLIPPYTRRDHTVLDPEKYMEILSNHDNVVAILSGHYHSEKVMKDNGIYHISTPALVEYPYRYRFVKIDNKGKLETKLLQIEK